MAEPEINAFLTYLAVKEKVAASTQNQALSAFFFFIVTSLAGKWAIWVKSSVPASLLACPSC
jgi:hypothetical protein